MTKAATLSLSVSILTALLTLGLPARAQFTNPGQLSNPGQIVIPNSNYGAGWLNSSLGSGIPYVGAGVPYVSTGIPYIGSGIPYVRSGIPYVGSGIPYVGSGIPYVRSGIPYVGSGIPYVGSVGSVISRIGGLGYGGYGYGRYGGWGGYNRYQGGIPSSGKLSNTTVIQTGPSPTSGTYYTPSAPDPSASGGYYKSTSPSQDDNAFYRSRYYKPASINNDNKNYWGGSGTPFPKDLNSTPWNP